MSELEYQKGDRIEHIGAPVFDGIIWTGDVGVVVEVKGGWALASWRDGMHSVPIENVRPGPYQYWLIPAAIVSSRPHTAPRTPSGSRRLISPRRPCRELAASCGGAAAPAQIWASWLDTAGSGDGNTPRRPTGSDVHTTPRRTSGNSIRVPTGSLVRWSSGWCACGRRISRRAAHWLLTRRSAR